MRTKKDFDYQNEYNRQNYDRIGLMLPKGMAELWKAEAKRRDLSLNALVQEAVKQFLHNDCTTCNNCDCEKSEENDK